MRFAPAWTWESSTRASSRFTIDIPADLRERCEDVILERRADATERLVEIAQTVKGGSGPKRGDDLEWRKSPVGQRLQHVR